MQPNAIVPNPHDAPPAPTRVGRDIRHLLTDRGTGEAALPGFDPEFRDLVDYILVITHRIWEEKSVGRIYDYYLHNCVIHTSSGDIYGRGAILAGTLQALAAFPDRRLYGDDVVWRDEGGGTYYSSHRIRHEGRNTGHTVYGAPTGRSISYRAIADCVCRENQIVEEWLIRDELTLIRQLGFDPHALAQRFAATMPTIAAGEVERDLGQMPPPVLPPPDPDAPFDPVDFVTRMIHEVWTWRLLDRVDAYFAPTFVGDSASERNLHGLGAYKAYLLSLLSPFPDLLLRIDHSVALDDGDDTYRVAIRWTLQGTHTGPGIYGDPRGARIQIIGVSHYRITGRRITHESTLFDEFALLKQLYAAADRL